MLEKSFVMLPGISYGREKAYHQRGIRTWEGFLEREKVPFLSMRKKQEADRIIRKARTAFLTKDAPYFKDFFSLADAWRLYSAFKGDAVYLDIETSGPSDQAELIVVGLYDGLETKALVKGHNLDLRFLEHYLKTKSLVITFNGASFDLPFLEKRGVDIRIPHIDLRIVFQQLSVGGGLKVIEKRFGIARDPVVELVSGGDPTKLWRMYRGSGDPYYLQLLLSYNAEDVFSLKKLMEHSHRMLTDLFSSE